MSNYEFKRVLRLPTGMYGLPNSYDLSEDPRYKDLFVQYPNKVTECFAPAPTVTSYLDYVLEYDNDSDMNAFGKARLLTEQEKETYAAEFEKIIPGIDMNDVRMVEFCWFTSSEAPDYYDIYDDEENPAADELLPCPICGNKLKTHGPEDWKPTWSDPDSGGDPYAFYCSCGYSFDSNSYDYEEAVAKANRRV